LPQEKTAESSISDAALESLYSELAREPHHDLKGIVIVRNGRVSGERYFNGDSKPARERYDILVEACCSVFKHVQERASYSAS
jgi:hypothetical protein